MTALLRRSMPQPRQSATVLNFPRLPSLTAPSRTLPEPTMACSAHPRLPCHALPIQYTHCRDWPIHDCRTAPILDLLRQAYPRLPNLSFAGQAYTKPNLPIRDCPALPCISCTRRAETFQDCHNKPHASGTSPTAHCRAPPRLPRHASPGLAKPGPARPCRALPCLSRPRLSATALPIPSTPQPSCTEQNAPRLRLL